MEHFGWINVFVLLAVLLAVAALQTYTNKKGLWAKQLKQAGYYMQAEAAVSRVVTAEFASVFVFLLGVAWAIATDFSEISLAIW